MSSAGLHSWLVRVSRVLWLHQRPGWSGAFARPGIGVVVSHLRSGSAQCHAMTPRPVTVLAEECPSMAASTAAGSSGVMNGRM